MTDRFEGVHRFADALARAGVRHLCLSPGSRSTPLAIACLRSHQYQVWTLLDERSAGFFAVGLTQAGVGPVALLCTSGTAGANYHPAVMEASLARLPLVVVTADRPPELHGIGSNQTVRQNDLFGSLVKWQFDMPVPSAQQTVLNQAEDAAFRLVQMAMTAPQGPVHLNWPFQEPLLPGAAEATEPRLLHAWTPELTPAASAVAETWRVVRSSPRGLIVCGPQLDAACACRIVDLGRRLGAPVVADVLSQARSTPAYSTSVIDTYDLWLDDVQLQDRLRPAWILRFGATPTSKALHRALQSWSQARHIVIDPSGCWRDAPLTATDVVTADPLLFCEQLAQASVADPQTGEWLQAWTRMNTAARAERERAVQTVEDASGLEGRVFTELSTLLPERTTLYCGNSMPVRDADAFFFAQQGAVRVLSNRGASGIDGVISSAAGAAAAAGGQTSTVLVIGDVSFYHDLNGLLAATQHAAQLLVIVIHNDGGGIFSMLPQAQEEDVFPSFRTPHGVDFSFAVSMFQGQWGRVETWEDFRAVVRDRLLQPGLSVVELRTDAVRNVGARRWVAQQVVHAVRRSAL